MHKKRLHSGSTGGSRSEAGTTDRHKASAPQTGAPGCVQTPLLLAFRGLEHARPECGATPAPAAARAAESNRQRSGTAHVHSSPISCPGLAPTPARPHLWQLQVDGDVRAVGVVRRRVHPQAHVPKPRALAGDAVVCPRHVHHVRLHLLGLRRREDGCSRGGMPTNKVSTVIQGHRAVRHASCLESG